MDNSKVHIGKLELQAFHDPEAADGYVYSIEASSNPKEKHQQHLFPRQLSGLSGYDLPKRTSISIYSIKSGFRPIMLAWFKRLDKESQITFSMSFDFHTWDLPESLSSFVGRYVEGLKKLESICSASSERDEHGYFVYCSVVVGSEDIFSKYCEMESAVDMVYRKYLLPTAPLRERSYGQDRVHWWIRYVIVPVVCSGAVAAVAIRFLAQGA